VKYIYEIHLCGLPNGAVSAKTKRGIWWRQSHAKMMMMMMTEIEPIP